MTIGKVYRNLVDFSAMYVGIVLFVNISPYFLPRLVRLLREETPHYKFGIAENAGGTAGLWLGGICLGAQLSFYFDNIVLRENPEYLIPFFGLNLVSGIGEGMGMLRKRLLYK